MRAMSLPTPPTPLPSPSLKDRFAQMVACAATLQIRRAFSSTHGVLTSREPVCALTLSSQVSCRAATKLSVFSLCDSGMDSGEQSLGLRNPKQMPYIRSE